MCKLAEIAKKAACAAVAAALAVTAAACGTSSELTDEVQGNVTELAGEVLNQEGADKTEAGETVPEAEEAAEAAVSVDEDPMKYIETAMENTAKAMAKNGYEEEYKLLEEAAADGTFTVEFEVEGIKFKGEYGIDEKEQKISNNITMTGTKGTSAGVYLYADPKLAKIGAEGPSGRHIYDIVFEGLEQKLAGSIFAPESGSGYALEQTEYDAMIENIKTVSEAMRGQVPEDNKYIGIINRFMDAHKPAVEKDKETETDGKKVSANVITYNISKNDIAGLWGQIADLVAEENDPEKFGRETKEKLRESLELPFEEMGELTLQAVFYVNGDDELMEFDMLITSEADGQRTDIALKVLYGAMPAVSQRQLVTARISSAYDGETSTVSISIDTKYSGNGSDTVISMAQGEESMELANLSEKRDGDSWTVTLDSDMLGISGKAEGTLKVDGGTLTFTVDKLSIISGSTEMSYLPKIVVTAKKGAVISEPEADKEFLDVTEEELDGVLEGIESDFEAVLEEYAENSAMAGYVKKSKLASANAKMGYTALAAEFTRMMIDGEKLSGSVLTGTGKGAAFEFDGKPADLSDYLGDAFEGYFYGEYDAEKYMPAFILWCADPIPNEYKHKLTADEREELAGQGVYIGCYPAAD